MSKSTIHALPQTVLSMLATLRQATSVLALQQALPKLEAALKQQLQKNGEQLPAYIQALLERVASSQTLERAQYYLNRLEKSLTEVKTNGTNDLNLYQWQQYDDILTDSLWVFNKRDSSGVHTAGYWGNFVPQIPHQLIKRYTKAGDWVLDCFLGSGTSLIEAQRLGRHGLGIELQPHVAAMAQTLLDSEPNPHQTNSLIQTGCCLAPDYAALVHQHQIPAFQLAILHPPYHDIIRFSDRPEDLSNAPSTQAFTEQLAELARKIRPVLAPGGMLALVISDKYENGTWLPLGFYSMQAVLNEGFKLKSIVVKNFEDTTAKRTQKELWRYRALAGGFYVFKHEYVFILQKPKTVFRKKGHAS